MSVWTAKVINGELELTCNQGEESGAIIRVAYGLSKLYEIPQYGGEPRFCGTYTDINLAIKEAESWT